MNYSIIIFIIFLMDALVLMASIQVCGACGKGSNPLCVPMVMWPTRKVAVCKAVYFGAIPDITS